jgi:tetratricopeptide (TPR) repeat protein
MNKLFVFLLATSMSFALHAMENPEPATFKEEDSMIRILPAHGRYAESTIDLNSKNPFEHDYKNTTGFSVSIRYSFKQYYETAETEGRHFVLAQFDVLERGKEKVICCDGYLLNRYLWGRSSFWGNQKGWNTGEIFARKLEEPKDLEGRNIVGPIHYFALAELADKSFYYVGSDHNFYTGRNEFTPLFFRSNTGKWIGQEEDMNELGIWYLNKDNPSSEDYKLAEFWLRKAIDRRNDHKSWKFWKNLAALFSKKGQYGAARECCLKALKLTHLTQRHQAALLHELGEIENHVGNSQTALKYGNESAHLWRALAEGHMQATDDRISIKAMDYFEKAALQSRVDGDLAADCLKKAGQLGMITGRYRYAEGCYHRLIDLKEQISPEVYIHACAHISTLNMKDDPKKSEEYSQRIVAYLQDQKSK